MRAERDGGPVQRPVPEPEHQSYAWIGPFAARVFWIGSFLIYSGIIAGLVMGLALGEAVQSDIGRADTSLMLVWAASTWVYFFLKRFWRPFVDPTVAGFLISILTLAIAITLAIRGEVFLAVFVVGLNLMALMSFAAARAYADLLEDWERRRALYR